MAPTGDLKFNSPKGVQRSHSLPQSPVATSSDNSKINVFGKSGNFATEFVKNKNISNIIAGPQTNTSKDLNNKMFNVEPNSSGKYNNFDLALAAGKVGFHNIFKIPLNIPDEPKTGVDQAICYYYQKENGSFT